MAEECVVGIYGTLEQAQQAAQVLDQSGYPMNQVSVVAPGHQEQLESDAEARQPLQYGDETEKDASIGAGMGGLGGLLAGAGLFMVPGLGPVFIAGPLAMGITGAIVGAFLGAMSGWGVHKDHIRQYEEKIKQGNALVVASGGPEQVAQAQSLLQEHTSPQELHLHVASADESPEVDDRPGR